MAPVSPHDQLRLKCHDRAFNAFGTSAIFQRRSIVLTRNLRLVSFAGIIVPVVIGATALAYGAGFKALPVLIAIGASVGVVQVVISVWSIVAGWTDAQTYAVTADVANQQIYTDFEDLADHAPDDFEAFRNKYDVLAARDDARKQEDGRKQITSEEHRYGMRAALREFERECRECHTVPYDLTARGSDCNVCGTFKLVGVK
jgi:mobilome CxxCx(11)CxxC protein